MARLPTRNDSTIDYATWRRVVDHADATTHFDARDFAVQEDPQGGQFVSLADKRDLTPKDFAIESIDGTKVAIYGGGVTVGHAEATCGDASLTLSASTSHVGWEYDYGSGTLAIVDFGSTFTQDAAHIRKRLYVFEVADGVASLVRDKTLDDVKPGNFAEA